MVGWVKVDPYWVGSGRVGSDFFAASHSHSVNSISDTSRRSLFFPFILLLGWLGSRVVSVLDSGAEGPGIKSQPRRCRVTVLGKLFTPSSEIGSSPLMLFYPACDAVCRRNRLTATACCDVLLQTARRSSTPATRRTPTTLPPLTTITIIILRITPVHLATRP